MAATERVTLIQSEPDRSILLSRELEGESAGLRIMVRTTTASLSDYPEWSLDELRGYRRDAVVTDGACS
jgi:hypothetical protein